MSRSLKKVTAIMLIAVTLVCLGGNAMAMNAQDQGDPSAGAMVADLILGRPLGIAAIILGSVTFVISSPFSALGGNFSVAADKLVVEPVVFTFKRPLGDF